jgi:hypothetical protein
VTDRVVVRPTPGRGGAGSVPGPREGAGAGEEIHRVAVRSVPLVARSDPRQARHRVVVGRKPGRVRRFVERYGWRAYAVPLLTLATIATLIDLATSAPSSPTGVPGTAAVAQAPATEASVAEFDTAPTAAAEGDAEPSQVPQTPGEETYVGTGAGSLSIVDGMSTVYGSGPLRRFIVEVEDGIAVDGVPFAQAVETTLGDPRSWGSGGRMSFQRVGAAEAAAGQFDFRVSLVSPGNMETYCPGVGTGGYTSCRYGDRAVINLARWATAVPHYEGDVATYRRYVVNHEVGHALGNGHQDCPGAGQVAPVMQQQTLGLDGCARNAWPYP